MKQCTKCKEHKSYNQFVKDRHNRTGWKSWCKSCFNEVRRNSPKQKATRKIYDNSVTQSERVFDIRLRKLYGIDRFQYDTMLSKQNNCCDICNRPETLMYKNKTTKELRLKRLSVDHCHKTGKIRSLLCTRCNSAIGQVFESIEILESAIQYLKKHK